MIINKISYKNEKVGINYSIPKGEGRLEEHTLSCNELPLPGFLNSLMKLRVFVLRMLEMPDKDPEIKRVTVRSLSFDYSDDGLMGVVISANRELQHSSGVQVLNTPHKFEDSKVASLKLDSTCYQYVLEMLEEAENYVNGERAQQELPLEKKEEIADGLLNGEKTQITTQIIDTKIFDTKEGTFIQVEDIPDGTKGKKKAKIHEISGNTSLYVKSKGKNVDIAPGFANRLTALLEQKLVLENLDLKKGLFSAGVQDYKVIFEKTGNILDIQELSIGEHNIQGTALVKNVVEEFIENLESKVHLLQKTMVN